MATTKKYQNGGQTRFEKKQAKKIAKAETRAKIAEIEGEGTVASRRDNRARRVSTMVGTSRAKTPKTLSTSTTSVDSSNSGNTYNTTNSGSSSNSSSGANSGSSSRSVSDLDNVNRRPVPQTGPPRTTRRMPKAMIDERAPKRKEGMTKPPKGWEDGPSSPRSTKRYQKGGTVKKTTKPSRKYIDSTIPMRGPDRPMPKMATAQKGGAMSDIKSGAKQVARGVKKGVKTAGTVAKAAIKTTPEYRAYKAAGTAAKKLDDTLEKRYPNYTKKGSVYDGVKQAAKTLLGYKTGGMVNPNSTVKRQAVAGSKGVKAGVNPRAAASKVAKGRPAKSTAPKVAIPKARMGGVKRRR